jgi:hypothetical protein
MTKTSPGPRQETIRRRFLLSLLVAAGSTTALPVVASAASSGYIRDQPTGPILVKYVWVPANTTATFETTNLRATAYTITVPDTVLHVLDVNMVPIPNGLR